MADYEVSGAYIDAILKPIRKAKQFDAVRAKLQYPVTELADNPWSRPWHPGIQYEAIGEAGAAVLGLEPYAELTYGAVNERFGPIALPMIQRAVNASGKSPAAVLGKLEGLITVAMKGLAVTWRLDSERAGLLVIDYPRAVAPHLEHSWRGLIKYVFEITQETARIERSKQLSGGSSLQYLISW